MFLFVKNNYLTKSLDSCLDSLVPVREHYGMFVSEFIHSKFFVANDGKYNPIILTVDGKRYGFIFTDPDEFEMAFPGPDSRSVRLDVDSLKNMLECLDFDAFILNVSAETSI